MRPFQHMTRLGQARRLRDLALRALEQYDLETVGLRYVAPDEFEPLQAAFREGYSSRRSWPEHNPGQIDAFRAGRIFWVANYVARYERPYFREHADRTARMFERFLDTGMLRRK